MKQIKRWQEPFYGIGGFGTGFMYMVAISYLSTLYIPSQQEGLLGAIDLAPVGIFSVIFFISRVIDGLIDIPIASWSDNLQSKWGKRRPLIVLGILPMIASYALMWFPPVAQESIINVIYLGVMSIIFFISYTMSTVPYLSSLSEIVSDEKSRVRVASWQTFFNTMGYVLAYVLVPILFDLLGKQMTVLVLLPCMLTILVPVFVIKEKSTKGTDKDSAAEPRVPLWDSLKMTLKNKSFRRYLYVYSTLFFGLQAFLSGMYYMAHDMMDLNNSQLGLMNAAAFAPIPLMLILLNIINRRKNIQLALRIALVSFSAAMCLFLLSWTGWNLPVSPFYIGMTAGVVGSFAIGVFFTVPYAIPAQIAAEEAAVTGKNRCAMYFAVQGLVNQIVGALAGTVLVLNIVTIEMDAVNATGALLVPPIIVLACAISFILVGKMKTEKMPAEKTKNS